MQWKSKEREKSWVGDSGRRMLGLSIWAQGGVNWDFHLTFIWQTVRPFTTWIAGIHFVMELIRLVLGQTKVLFDIISSLWQSHEEWSGDGSRTDHLPRTQWLFLSFFFFSKIFSTLQKFLICNYPELEVMPLCLTTLHRCLFR